MQAVTDQIRNFLQYIAVQFIEHPERAQLKVAELGPKRLRFKLVLESSDVALLIGRNGFSASAIRGVLKAAAERADVQVNLQVHSHEEEAEMLAREEAGS
ncbi:KH domain-containing protein [Haloferula sp. A504]|uniref:KH domain-containing protein n=1 Tax=Haloferula sp. A504 TaxID=3373601 RepID=UPI0031C603F0|nr:KH domain-containing protein [Verrucomicrobiaceae bacterium E54]